MARARKRNTTQRSRYPRTRAAVSIASKAFRAWSGSRKTTQNATRIKPSTVSFQKDVTRQYNYKRMPARKRKPWVKFVRKVKAVEATGRGTQSIVINDSFTTSVLNGTPTPGVSQDQIISEVNLYSNNNTSTGGNDQDYILNEVANMRQTLAQTGVAGQLFNVSTQQGDERSRNRVNMKHANIDITYTNTGDVTLELDLYTITHSTSKRPMQGLSTTAVSSLAACQVLYNAAMANNTKLQYLNDAGVGKSSGEQVFMTQRGVTPFQCPGINIYAKAKIMNKTKILISPGNSITRRYSDSAHRYITAHEDDIKNRYDKNTLTYLAIAKPNKTSTAEASLRTGYTKNYSWTTEGVNTPRATYFPDNLATNASNSE